MRFALLLYADPGAAAATTRSEAMAELARYSELNEEMDAAGVLVGGEALVPGHQAVQVGSERRSDGGAVHTDLELSGFYVLDCESIDEAVKWAGSLPVVGHGVVEIRPVLAWPD